MADKEVRAKLRKLENEQKLQEGKIELINEKIKSKKEDKKISVQTIVAIISALIALCSLGYTIYSTHRDNEQKRMQSYYEPMALNLEFSKKYESIRVDGEKFYIKPVMADSTKGFIKSCRGFYVDTKGTIIVSDAALFGKVQDREAKKLKPNEKLISQHKSSVPITGNSNNLFYGTEYMLFEDYQGNKELQMFVYVFDKKSRKSKAQFSFDRYFLLLEGQKIFSLPKSSLDNDEQTLAVSYINENIEQFSLLNSKLRALKLID